jgi:hypothetical protein
MIRQVLEPTTCSGERRTPLSYARDRFASVGFRNRYPSTNWTRNFRAFQPAIPIRILRVILLVIIHHIKDSRENRGVTSPWMPTWLNGYPGFT